MKYRFITIFLYCLFLSHCGFKLVNLETNYKVAEINIKGDKKINYKLKNKILNYSKKDSENLIEIRIDTKKNKSIKEKNVKNQITKYEINITTNFEYKDIDKGIFKTFVITKIGDYIVSTKYSDTLNSEKNLVDALTNNLLDEILENLSLNFNDL